MTKSFQLIGVTKDWRHNLKEWLTKLEAKSFQSIGVTKDWRLPANMQRFADFMAFPINRRHQGLATRLYDSARLGATLVSNQ